jgi:thiamine biosynthesis lipoprotein
MFSFSFEAFGTVLEIQVFDKVPKILQEKIKTEIFDYTIFFDDNFSRFKSDSLITKISNNPGIYSVPQELTEMLRHYEKFYNATNGAMNPLVGNTLSDLGYDAKYTLRPKEKISETPKLNEVVKIVSDTQIEVKEKALIYLLHATL